eukprot:4424849-Amphidinium_carterae.1
MGFLGKGFGVGLDSLHDFARDRQGRRVMERMQNEGSKPRYEEEQPNSEEPQRQYQLLLRRLWWSQWRWLRVQLPVVSLSARTAVYSAPPNSYVTAD